VRLEIDFRQDWLMGQPLLAGVALTMAAGLMSGTCMLPLKFVRSWKWENLWLVFSLVSLVIIPWMLAIGLVGSLFETYRTLPFRQLAIPMLFGAGWGVAQILFGISVKRLGLGIAYAVIVGLGAVLGTLVPLFAQQRPTAKEHAIQLIVGGVAVMVIGILLTAWGGQIKERATHISQSASQRAYPAAIFLAVLCGFMAPMLNYSFAFGQGIAQAAVRLGNQPVHGAYAVWPIGLAGGFLPNAAYSLWLLFKNRTWPLFRYARADLLWSCLMGILWMGAFALYGMSATFLGALGTSVGWGLLQIFMIMTATLAGALTGEWKHASRSATLLLSSGIASLTVAIVLLALGSL
jgi:multidrug transporter EmrE-like cation transporter